MRLPPADCSLVTADDVVHGQLPGVHSGQCFRFVARRPLHSRWPGGQRSGSDQFLNGDLDRRRREISLGKRPVDCTVVPPLLLVLLPCLMALCLLLGPSLRELMVDRSIGRPSTLPVGVHLECYLVGAPSVVTVQEWCLCVRLVPLVGLLLLVSSPFFTVPVSLLLLVISFWIRF